MRENKFEKQVRNKLEHLGFTPTESVWAGVDKEIKKEIKRRIPLFWLFFVPALLVAGSSYYFIANKKTSGITPDKNVTGTIAKPKEQDGNSRKKMEQPVAQTSVLQQDDIIKPSVRSTELQKTGNKSNSGAEATNKKQHFTGFASTKQKVNHTGAGLNSGKKPAGSLAWVKTKESGESVTDAAGAATADIVINNYNDKSANSETGKDNKKIFDSTAGKLASSATESKSKKDSLAGAITENKKEQEIKSSKWEIGYTLGVGQSNLNQNLFNSVKTLSPVNFSTNAVAQSANGGNINYSSSEISPGFSFGAGAFVNRNLSKRFSISGGISYHYYSTTIRTGGKINTTLVTSNSMNQTIVADSYYENGHNQTFVNQYHFIEIPLTVNFQVNKSKKIPFIWELGLSPGYIISSNALYYDPNTNVYFSNYLKPNRMQLNGVTAFMVGFPLSDGQLQIGPQLQYGFTGFVNTNDGNPGHLFYAGLKISFIPGKK